MVSRQCLIADLLRRASDTKIFQAVKVSAEIDFIR